MRVGGFVACRFAGLSLAGILSAAVLCVSVAPGQDAVELLKLDFQNVRLAQLSTDAGEPIVELSSPGTGKVPQQKWRTEIRTRIVPVVESQKSIRTQLAPVTIMRKEKRTRKVTIDGKQVDQEYTVKIPVTGQQLQTDVINEPLVVNVEESYEVLVPISPDEQQEPDEEADEQGEVEQAADRNFTTQQTLTTKFADISAWDVHGHRIAGDDLSKRLSRPTGVFLLARPISAGVKITPTHLAVLREDTLFLYLHTNDRPQLGKRPAAP